MRILVFLFVFYCISCQNPPPESRFDKIAAAYCDCTAQLAALNKQAVTMSSDTAVHVDFRALQTEYEKAKECAITLTTRFGKLKPQELTAMEKSLTVKCPDLAAQPDLLRELMGE